MQVEEGKALVLQLQADLGDQKERVQQLQEQLQVCNRQFLEQSTLQQVMPTAHASSADLHCCMAASCYMGAVLSYIPVTPLGLHDRPCPTVPKTDHTAKPGRKAADTREPIP